jgi:hypothetical protein
MPKQFQDKLLNIMESGHIKVDQSQVIIQIYYSPETYPGIVTQEAKRLEIPSANPWRVAILGMQQRELARLTYNQQSQH